MRIHPYALLFPPMQDHEFEALKTSLKRTGLVNEILLYDGEIVDGRSRFFACTEIGIAPRYRTVLGTPEEIIELVTGLNAGRRNLAPSQKAAVAARICDVLQVEARKRMAHRSDDGMTKLSEADKGRTVDFAARVVGVSSTYVTVAKAIRERAPELFEQMIAGETTIMEAKRSIDAAEAAEAPSATTDVAVRSRLPHVTVPDDAESALICWGSSGDIARLKDHVTTTSQCLEMRRNGTKWLVR